MFISFYLHSVRPTTASDSYHNLSPDASTRIKTPPSVYYRPVSPPSPHGDNSNDSSSKGNPLFILLFTSITTKILILEQKLLI